MDISDAVIGAEEPKDVIAKGMYHNLFPEGLLTSPNLSEVYELSLAYYESRVLTKEELLNNSAYFIKVDDQYTNHYFICTGDPVKIPDYSSSRLKSFFINNQFRTGYSTHGLFPYRGKFHPQMIKALINILGIKPGETVLDPMMGSGTVPVEAALMGINSVGVDSSPFCRFMAQTKCEALTIQYGALKGLFERFEKFFKDFASSPREYISQKDTFIENNSFIDRFDMEKLFNLLFLAFLDSEGYAKRSKRKSHLDHFKSILERYITVVEKITSILAPLDIIPTRPMIRQGDARCLDIEDNSIDGIIFSPPYSFAIDYLENDLSHLAYFGEDIPKLSETMIGMRGKTLKQKYENYLVDMDKVLSECSRVLKQGRFCAIVIGTNDSQLSRVLKVPKQEVTGLNKIMVEMGKTKGLSHVRSLPRQIVGMANTLRHEYIVILQK